MDRQGSGKKPLNYLTSTYGETFRFEDAADGQNWVSLPGVAPVASPAPEAEDAPVEATEVSSEATAPEETVSEETVAEAASALQAEAVSAPEPEAAEEGYVTPQQITDRLVAGGFDADIASQVTGIFAESASYRAAYNKLRSVFGNTTGRDYYQRAKEILTAPEA